MIPIFYKYKGQEGYPYKCDDFKCNCRMKDDSVRHCPECGDLYYWSDISPEMPCINCELLVELKRLEKSRVKFK